MRWIFLSLLSLTGCASDPPEVAECEKYVIAKLKAPSTYKRISAESVMVPEKGKPRQTVVVEYDAANSFNAPIRDKQLCFYPVVNGVPDTGSYIDHDARLMDQVEAEIAEDPLLNR